MLGIIANYAETYSLPIQRVAMENGPCVDDLPMIFMAIFHDRLFTYQGLQAPRKEKGRTVQQFREAVKFMKGRDEQEQMEDGVQPWGF